MTLYILRRLLINIPVLLGITILVFTFLMLAPGDPVSAYIKPKLGDNPVLSSLLDVLGNFDIATDVSMPHAYWT